MACSYSDRPLFANRVRYVLPGSCQCASFAALICLSKFYTAEQQKRAPRKLLKIYRTVWRWITEVIWYFGGCSHCQLVRYFTAFPDVIVLALFQACSAKTLIQYTESEDQSSGAIRHTGILWTDPSFAQIQTSTSIELP